jgi:hypothetical protein
MAGLRTFWEVPLNGFGLSLIKRWCMYSADLRNLCLGSGLGFLLAEFRFIHWRFAEILNDIAYIIKARRAIDHVFKFLRRESLLLTN